MVKPVGYLLLNVKESLSNNTYVVYTLQDGSIFQTPTPVKKTKTNPTTKKTVHEKRKATKEFRKKQFQHRLEANKEWKKGQAQRRLLKEEAKRWKELKREDRRKKYSPRVCPLVTCPKRVKHFKNIVGSPASIVTHISNDSGRRSRSPINFGNTSN